MTKIILFNIPSGPTPSDTLPIGISRVIEGIDPSLNCDVKFVDIDHTRPSFEELLTIISQYQPRIIGFSAILTHAYAYLKSLSAFLKSNYPDGIQVLGGQMSVLSNILLQRTNIDFCVTGESEPAFSNLIHALMNCNFKISDPGIFLKIRGLAFMQNGIPHFTGYEEPVNSGIRQMNYELIAKYTDVERFLPKITGDSYRRGINKYEIDAFYGLIYPWNIDKRILHVSSSKGCVGKCTFCHRFFKGYRSYDPENVISHIKQMRSKYDIGLIQFYGENFGSDKHATDVIINYLKENKLNWIVGGTRVDTIDEKIITEWKEAGCISIGFGIESCSQKMLDVMEKRTTIAENLNAIRLTFKHRVLGGILLLLGMPGETDDTIQETIDNLATVIPDDMDLPYEFCFNFFQAVPGTPGYEYARRIGLIGVTLDEEEKYVESLYNINANDINHYLNFTDYAKEETAYWPHYILLELITAYIKKHGVIKVLKLKKANRYRYAMIYMLLFRPLRKTILKYAILIHQFGFARALRVLHRKLFKRNVPFFSLVHESLRLINKRMPLEARPDDIYTNVLRDAR